MPDEVEVPLEHAQEHISEAHEEHAEKHSERHGTSTGDRWIRYMAVVTAILAVIAAIGALQSGLLINESLLQKNDQIKNLTQASDEWNYYQAEGLKSLIYSSTAQVLPAGSTNVDKNLKQAANYKKKQDALRKEAERLTDESKKNDEESVRMLHVHHLFAISVSLCQIAIALSAVAALTKRPAVWMAGLVAGGFGFVLLVLGFLPWHTLQMLHLA